MIWRGAAMVLAGPAADVFSLWLFVNYWSLIFAPAGTYELYESMPLVIRYLVAIQGYTLLYSLWPHDVKIDGLTTPNDAKHFINYVSGKYTKERREAIADLQAYEDGLSRYAPGFKAGPSSWIRQITPEEANLWLEAQSESEKQNLSAAIEKFEVLIQSPRLQGPERAQILDGMASTAVMHGHAVPTEKILSWAREAHALAPDARTVRGTLGGALVQTGDYTGAIEMLTPLTTPDNEQIDRVLSSLYLAKAWDKQGDPIEAARWFSLAGEVGGYDSIRDRIAAELSPEARGERA
jgi:hypothetical protein